MADDKIVTGESFGKDRNEDEITANEITSFKSENVEDNLVSPAYKMTWSECKIRQLIQGIEYQIMKLEAKRSQIDAKTSAAAKLGAKIEFLLSDRDILQKNLDEFLMKLADQQREDTFKEDKEITCRKRKYDSAGTSASSGSTQEQWENMFNLKSDSSSEEEIEIQNRNDDKKLRDNESFVDRMHKRIEAAFNGSDSDDDEPSQDPDFGIHTNIEGLDDDLRKLFSSDAEELKESKVENDDVDLK